MDYVKSLYGIDGTAGYDTCTITIKDLTMDRFNDGIDIFHFPIAYASGRDSGAKLEKNVVLISGKITSGGSVKNWKTAASNATVDIFDIPVAATKLPAFIAANNEGWASVKQ